MDFAGNPRKPQPIVQCQGPQMAPRLKSNKREGGWLTFTSQCIHFSTMSAGDAITDLCILVWICSEGVGMRPEFERVFWGGGFHALYISLGTSDTPRPPKQMLLLLSREMRSYRHYDHNHCTLTYYKINQSFSLPYGGIPGFSGACWKAQRFLPWLLRWGTLTVRESLEMRNGSNVELK